MTVASQVKETLVTLKSAHASFDSFVSKTSCEESCASFEKATKVLEDIILDLTNRVGELEFEEPQYKGN